MNKKKFVKYYQILKRFVFLYFSVIFFFLLFSVVLNLRGVVLIKKRDFSKAENNFNLAKKMSTIPNQMTFSIFSILEFNYIFPEVAELGCKTIRNGVLYKSLVEFKKDFDDLSDSIQDLSDLAEKSFCIKILINENQLKNLAQFVCDCNEFFSWLMTDNKRIIILLQNSDEIRASGGFIGSYARIALDHGQVSFFDIADIYNPEGQFDGFIEPPPGVKEYLSEGGSWKLTDANWHVDFPTAAMDIKKMMSFGGETDLDMIVTVNLEVIEKLINDLGSIYLSEEDEYLTSDNFTKFARADRDSYIPGSTQKVDFLADAFGQILLKIQVASLTQQNQLLNTIFQQIEQKNLLFFSSNKKIQQLFHKYRVDGSLSSQNFIQINLEDSLFEYLEKVKIFLSESLPLIYLVESNVGINKANKGIERNVKIEQIENNMIIIINFSNNNLPPKPIVNWDPALHGANHLSYINYQRVVVSCLFEVKEVWQDHVLISKLDKDVIQTQNGEEFNQTGFLITVPEQKSSEVKIVLKNTSDQKIDKLLVIKQPGLSDVKYLVKTPSKEVNFLLNNDFLVR